MENTLHIAIVDDEVLTADILRSAPADDYFISVYDSAQAALDGIDERNLPDVILMDINLPDMSGIDLTYIIRERYPRVDVIMLTVNEDASVIIRAIEAGASGYLLKGITFAEILHAIEIVRGGGSFLTPSVARKILRSFQRKPQKTTPAAEYSLTEREEEILRYLVDDMSDLEISKKCFISPHTVNNHLRSIYKKLQVNSRIEARLKIMGDKPK